MTDYRIRESGELKSQGEIRAMHKNTSFPKVWGENVHEAIGIDPVLLTPKPESAEAYKHYTRNGAEQDANGNWVQAWTEGNMFSKRTDADGVVHTKAQQETAYQAKLDATAAEGVRRDRDSRLAVTDFHGLTDTVMSEAMTEYRQALRDVPEQAGFPHEVTWPDSP
jgi:hypothetical protein|tara:strand:- start:2077 stop:2574 length:498 start_codon:yes stop_codon:yes gene_type:complete